jgi:predicted Zn-dependent peptidase
MALTASAQERETPPPIGLPKPFAAPAGETFTLPNGMQVTLAQHGSVPLVTVSARIAFGSINENADQVWLSKLTAELMKEGTKTRSGAQVAEDAARMGGQLDISAGMDETTASIDVLSEFAPRAVQLLADVLENAALPASELDRLRANLLRQRAVQLATPQAQASQAFYAALFPDHPYGRQFPTEAELKAYSIDDVRKFYRSNAGARRTHLYVVGRFDPTVRKTIEEAFAAWLAGPEPQRAPAQPAAKPALTLIDRPGAVQSTLRIGLRLSVKPADTDYIPLALTNDLLGGAFTSRITNNIREQKGYTYSPFSRVATFSRAAFWQETADVTTEHTADSIREILFEINRLRKDPPDAKELRGIQNLAAGVFVVRNSSNQGIVGQLAFVHMHGLSDDYLKTYVQKVNAVTRQDIQRIAESYLDPAKMTIVVVGDTAKVGESLKPYER